MELEEKAQAKTIQKETSKERSGKIECFFMVLKIINFTHFYYIFFSLTVFVLFFVMLSHS